MLQLRTDQCGDLDAVDRQRGQPGQCRGPAGRPHDVQDSVSNAHQQISQSSGRSRRAGGLPDG
jgi:hypothetical protein